MFYLRPLDSVVIRGPKTAMHSDSDSEQVQYRKHQTGRDGEEKRKQRLYLCTLPSVLQRKRNLALNAVSTDNSANQHQHRDLKCFCIFPFCHLGGGLLTNVQQRQFQHK